MNYLNIFNSNIDGTFKMAAKLLTEYPKYASSMLRISAHEVKAKKIRSKWFQQGVSVPPLLIVSTTDDCNLVCKECYSANTCRKKKNEMSKDRIDKLLNEASTAGCSTILLAGGEPLLAPDWMDCVAQHKELLGLVFTNGTLFNDEWFQFFSSHRNMIALFSLEGSPERTDNRRGFGVTKIIKEAMAKMYEKKIPFGISVTTGSHNFDEVTADGFIEPYIELGCRIVIHVEYVPMGESEEFLPLTVEEKMRLSEYCSVKQDKSKAILIAFPGNEEIYGGCLAAGRGFLHISASGLLEPCPFAPYSDRDLTNMSFIEALQSPLLKALREESNLLHEGVGGCSLRGKEEWINEILAKEKL